ncbi:MAG: phage portal protein [Dehalococcoidia bacterium]
MNDFNPAHLNRIDTDRRARYLQNLNFYQGQHWETRTRHRQLVFNYAKAVVDKVTSFLMHGASFTCFPAAQGEDALARARRAEELINQVRHDNNLDQLDYETEVDTAVLGDGCYKVTWDADQKRIRVTAPDVSGIFAWWIGDDLSRVWRVASRYTLDQDEVTVLYGRDPGRKTATVTELWTADEFSLYIENALIESRPNPYGFIPFIIFPNVRDPKHFWGVSDIPVIMQPQRELNRAFSQLSRILELSGNPIAVLENVSEAEDIKVQPGALWTIPEDAKAYLLDLLQGGGVRLHIDYIDHVYRTMHDVSETPRAAWGGVERELSGAALRIELGSLIQKVIRKRLVRTNVYYRRNAMIITLAEIYMKHDFHDVNHRMVWGPILPQDTDRQAQTEQLLVQAGVHSRRTAMDQMNIQDPDEEFDRWLQERKRILEMNQEFQARSTRGGARERATAPEMEVPE